MSASQKEVNRIGVNNPMFGKTHSEEVRAKLYTSQIDNCQKIEIFDKDKNETTTHDSIRAAARALNIKQSRIATYFSQNQKKPYKGRYIFKKID